MCLFAYMPMCQYNNNKKADRNNDMLMKQIIVQSSQTIEKVECRKAVF